ncbi:MAG TPA: PAS domain-containing sensor histidine kinase [Chloroflexota bacterium]|nr:PAS domain-containing sensor histidine kinase [Chloroflexota bacterium]
MNGTARQVTILVLLGLLAVGVFVADITINPGNPFPAAMYAFPILLAAYLLPPRMAAGIAVWCLSLEILADFVQRASLSWVHVLYVAGVAIVAVLAVGLSSRIEREAALAKENERLAEAAQSRYTELSTIIDSIADAVFVSDDRGVITLVNNAGLRLTGDAASGANLTLADFLRALHLRFLADGRPVPLDDLAMARALRGETVQGREEVGVHPVTGQRVDLLASAAPVRDRSGRVTGAVEVAADVTQIRELSEEVQRRAAELNAAISSSADGLIIFNSGWETMLMNPAAERLLGLSKEELKQSGARALELLHIETAEGNPLPLEELPHQKALGGEQAPGVVAVIHPPHGRDLWVTMSAPPIRVPSGRLLGAVLTFTDITPIHDLEQQRAKHVLGISHGLRTPLTVIQGHAQLLLKELENARMNGRMQKGTETIVASAQRMSLLLRDLVDLTALESRQPLQLNLEPIDVHSFLSELKERIAGFLDVGRIRMDVPEELPTISADPDRLERTLVNLLSNAFKYSDPGTDITVNVLHSNGEVIFSVTDQGKGIPPEQLPHLFDPYRRTMERPESAGLGLYIAKGLVEAHGGRIWVESQMGRGSTFSLALPSQPH